MKSRINEIALLAGFCVLYFGFVIVAAEYFI